jgi:hypothetical protein
MCERVGRDINKHIYNMIEELGLMATLVRAWGGACSGRGRDDVH